MACSTLAAAVFSAAMKEETSVLAEAMDGLLGVDVGFGLHVLDRGEDLALVTWSPSLTIEVGDAAEGGGADVDVGLGLDLAGAADDRGEVLADDFAGEHGGVSGLSLEHHEGDNAGNDEKRKDSEDDFFHNWMAVRKSPLTVYAMEGPGVPGGDILAGGAGRRGDAARAEADSPEGNDRKNGKGTARARAEAESPEGNDRKNGKGNDMDAKGGEGGRN